MGYRTAGEARKSAPSTGLAVELCRSQFNLRETVRWLARRPECLKSNAARNEKSLHRAAVFELAEAPSIRPLRKHGRRIPRRVVAAIVDAIALRLHLSQQLQEPRIARGVLRRFRHRWPGLPLTVDCRQREHAVDADEVERLARLGVVALLPGQDAPIRALDRPAPPLVVILLVFRARVFQRHPRAEFRAPARRAAVERAFLRTAHRRMP